MKGVRFDYGTENTEKNFIDQLSLNIEDVIDFWIMITEYCWKYYIILTNNHIIAKDMIK